MTNKFLQTATAFLLLFILNSNISYSQIACNANIDLSLDINGNANFTVDMAEEGTSTAYETKWVIPTEFSCENVGTPQFYYLIGEYTNGDRDTCSGYVNVSDITAPVPVAETLISVQLDESGSFALQPEMIDDGSYDACGEVTFTLFPATLDCSSSNPTAVALTVTDESGNSNTAIADVYWEGVPSSTSIECGNFSTLNVANGPVELSLPDILASGSSVCPNSYSFVIELNNVVENDWIFDSSDAGNTFDVTLLDWSSGQQCEFSFAVVDGSNLTPIECFGDIDLSLDNFSGTADFTVAMAEEGNSVIYESKWVNPSEFTCEDVGTPQVYYLIGEYANGDRDTCSGYVNVFDVTPPVVVVDVDVTVQLDELGSVVLLPEMIDDGSYDACGALTYTVSPSNLDCSSSNPTAVVLTATDDSGNSNSAITNVYWEGIANSAAVECTNLSTVNVFYGPVELNLYDVLASGSSVCPSNYSFTVELNDVEENDLIFDSSDVGNTFDVTVVDWTTGLDCEFSFTVVSEDVPSAICVADFSGKATVDVEITDGVFTDDSGCANINLAPGTVLAPAKQGDPAEGVDIVDYMIMRSAILGASTLTADQLIASDLSGDGEWITTLDLVYLQKMYLDEFIPEKVWKFRDANESFPDNILPSNFSETITIENAGDSYSFVAIKMGDLDLSYEEVLSSTDVLSLVVKDITLNNGEVYQVPLSLEDDNQLTLTNIFVEAETADYIITGVTSILPGYVFDADSDIVDGVLNLQWTAEDGVIENNGYTVTAGSPLYTLTIEAKANAVLNETFAMYADQASKILPSAATKGIALELDIQELITVPVFNTQEVESMVVSPNPCDDLFTVKSDRSATGTRSFYIYNAIGQVVQTGIYENAPIDVANLPSGLYTVLLKSENNYEKASLVKK